MKLKAIVFAFLVTAPTAFAVTLECDAFVIKTINVRGGKSDEGQAYVFTNCEIK
ncbi:hypothetical protein AADP37_05265 [Escherichia coli]